MRKLQPIVSFCLSILEVGDFIEVKGTIGKVAAIEAQYVKLEVSGGAHVVVPMAVIRAGNFQKLGEKDVPAEILSTLKPQKQ